MIKIEAIIKPEKATSIGLALEDAGVGGYFLSNITGKGNQKGVEVTTGRGTNKITRSSVPKTVITTVVDDIPTGQTWTVNPFIAGSANTFSYNTSRAGTTRTIKWVAYVKVVSIDWT